MKRSVLWLVAAFSLTTSVVGCGGDPCQDAFEKVKSCWSSVNCSTYPQDQQTLCTQSKTVWSSATSPSQCNNPDAVLSCDLDPTKLCGCKK